MNDLISRQAAITLPVIPKEYREYQTSNLDDAYEQGWNDLQKCIESLPSAQQWIPCSERLPEEGAPVLGSFEVEGDRFILPTSIFVFDEEEGKSWTGTMGLKPIAWMLLPEPYREEDNQCKD